MQPHLPVALQIFTSAGRVFQAISEVPWLAVNSLSQAIMASRHWQEVSSVETNGGSPVPAQNRLTGL
jgi:hypothetical protein